MTNRQKQSIAWGGVACAVLFSLWLRVGPVWRFVFTPRGVDFQGPDAWFHLRTAHNLLAHFPFRSGFDPYALFPGGMNMPTGPLWDYMIASAAWIVGLGSPSPALTDYVAAWLPAILGAVCPIPVFWVTRRLFGLTAGLFAALWVAVTPGEFIWLTHLGNADHHAAEGFFSVLAFCFLCVALDAREKRTRQAGLFIVLLPVLAGVSLGALLATQPAAIFVPGILVAATVFEPSLAQPALYAFGAAAVTLFPVAQTPSTGYDWLSLGGGSLAVAAIWLLDLPHLRKGWPSGARWIAAAIGVVLVLGIAELWRPALIASLFSEIHDLNTSHVAELQPVVLASNGLRDNIAAMTFHLGIIWIPALPGLLWIVVFAFRKRQPSLTLLALFSLAFTIAAFMHLRMILYFVPFAAILAGAVSAWLLRFVTGLFAGNSKKLRWALGVALAGILLSLNIRPALDLMTVPGAGAGRDWFEALTWLRLHSPEPFGDGGLWNGYFPRWKAGQTPSLPAPSYSIAVWWDTGYMVEYLARRVPITNGFGAGIDEEDAETRTRDMAGFYAGIFSESAVNLLRKMNARYVIVDDSIPVFSTMAGRSKLGVMQQTAGYDPENFYHLMWRDVDGSRKPVFVYFPDYYQTMGVRLFLGNGEAVHGTGPVVFTGYNDGAHHDVITAAKRFASERAAADFVTAHSRDNLTIGCANARVSCFDVPAVHGLRLVFTSSHLPNSLDEGDVHTVKIFEVEPAPPTGSR